MSVMPMMMKSGMMVRYRCWNISTNKYGASARRAAVSRFGRCFTYNLGNHGMGGAGSHLVMGNDFVDGGIRHDLVDQREVHRVAGFFGDDVTEKRLPDQ